MFPPAAYKKPLYQRSRFYPSPIVYILRERCLQRTLCFNSGPPDSEKTENTVETSSHPSRRNHDGNPAPIYIRDIGGRNDEFSMDTHSFATPPPLLPKRVSRGDHAGINDSIDFQKEENVVAM
ncbi:uncharacterized protein BCR38DRAFT_103295 [Pseudomassariella vexata]|uniref:Uncharacterized protein n=1 Tax=Pseudomassariella vexata TaxID=1141098 RepID=A0A1Y2EHK8_9PEZI|nr:uncharacterized protein BCR38DRAFT_103295 [Pseudomassariella vexata]ORY70265.1 hypothetical protein BCR38DRAFT_103295 [Pseudomassariella vexata]